MGIMKLSLISTAVVCSDIRIDDVPTRMAKDVNDCGFFEDDIESCAYRIQHNLEFFVGGKYTCAVTYQMPAWGWQTWDHYNDRYRIYAICGNASSNSINGKVLQQSCENASYLCGTDEECVLDRIVADHQNGRFKFCRDRFDLLVNPHPGPTAYYGYNGAMTWNSINTCTAYCT